MRLKTLFASLAIASCIATSSPAAEASRQPNILLITLDTLRADHLSSYGYHLETSPNIDRLAREGVLFERAYTVTSRTAPSHFSIFTSRYPQEHGAKLNGFAVPEDSKFVFLPQILQAYGYRNAAFVSCWPLTKRLSKLDRFFDVYDEDLNRKYQMINSMRYAEDVAPRAISWLEQNKDENFFAWVHFFDPHSPYDLREDFEPVKPTGKPDLTKQRGQSEILDVVRGYNSEIFYTDHYVGEILDAVDSLGLRDNTLVILLADHGEMLGERNYQGHSRRLYESVVHIPLIFRLPGRIAEGRRIKTQVTTLDILPTVLDLTVRGIEAKDIEAKLPADFAGRTLAPTLIANEALPDRSARFVSFAGQKWIMPKWFAKLWLRGLDFPLRVGYRSDDRKVIWAPGDKDMEIYDLAEDPFEMHPLDERQTASVYKKETAGITEWFEATNLSDGENRMDDRDREALESLGYIQ